MIKRMAFCAAVLCLMGGAACAQIENVTFSFPCEPEISPFFSKSEHAISRAFDLAQHHRMEIDDFN